MAASGPGSSSASHLRRCLKQRSAHFIARSSRSTRDALKIRVASQNNKKQQAFLPFCDVRESLAAHPLVVHMKLDVMRVYAVLVQLLVEERDGEERHEASSEQKSGRAAQCDFAQNNCAHCTVGRLVEEYKHGFVVCDNCGVCSASVIDHGVPYRYFGEGNDRVHWESPETSPERWPLVDQLLHVVEAGSTIRDKAKSLLTRLATRQKVSAMEPAVVAALIAAERPTVLVDRVVGKPVVPPVVQFKCPDCGAAVSSKKDGRFHCRLNSRYAAPLRRSA